MPKIFYLALIEMTLAIASEFIPRRGENEAEDLKDIGNYYPKKLQIIPLSVQPVIEPL